jgi:hypothetical protein
VATHQVNVKIHLVAVADLVVVDHLEHFNLVFGMNTENLPQLIRQVIAETLKNESKASEEAKRLGLEKKPGFGTYGPPGKPDITHLSRGDKLVPKADAEKADADAAANSPSKNTSPEIDAMKDKLEKLYFARAQESDPAQKERISAGIEKLTWDIYNARRGQKGAAPKETPKAPEPPKKEPAADSGMMSPNELADDMGLQYKVGGTWRGWMDPNTQERYHIVGDKLVSDTEFKQVQKKGPGAPRGPDGKIMWQGVPSKPKKPVPPIIDRFKPTGIDLRGNMYVPDLPKEPKQQFKVLAKAATKAYADLRKFAKVNAPKQTEYKAKQTKELLDQVKDVLNGISKGEGKYRLRYNREIMANQTMTWLNTHYDNASRQEWQAVNLIRGLLDGMKG